MIFFFLGLTRPRMAWNCRLDLSSNPSLLLINIMIKPSDSPCAKGYGLQSVPRCFLRTIRSDLAQTAHFGPAGDAGNASSDIIASSQLFLHGR